MQIPSLISSEPKMVLVSMGFEPKRGSEPLAENLPILKSTGKTEHSKRFSTKGVGPELVPNGHESLSNAFA